MSEASDKAERTELSSFRWLAGGLLSLAVVYALCIGSSLRDCGK